MQPQGLKRPPLSLGGGGGGRGLAWWRVGVERRDAGGVEGASDARASVVYPDVRSGANSGVASGRATTHRGGACVAHTHRFEGSSRAHSVESKSSRLISGRAVSSRSSSPRRRSTGRRVDPKSRMRARERCGFGPGGRPVRAPRAAVPGRRRRRRRAGGAGGAATAARRGARGAEEPVEEATVDRRRPRRRRRVSDRRRDRRRRCARLGRRPVAPVIAEALAVHRRLSPERRRARRKGPRDGRAGQDPGRRRQPRGQVVVRRQRLHPLEALAVGERRRRVGEVPARVLEGGLAQRVRRRRLGERRRPLRRPAGPRRLDEGRGRHLAGGRVACVWTGHSPLAVARGAVGPLEPRLCATERVDCGRFRRGFFVRCPRAPPSRARRTTPDQFRALRRPFFSERKAVFATVGLDRFARGCRRVDRRVSGDPFKPSIILNPKALPKLAAPQVADLSQMLPTVDVAAGAARCRHERRVSGDPFKPSWIMMPERHPQEGCPIDAPAGAHHPFPQPAAGTKT